MTSCPELSGSSEFSISRQIILGEFLVQCFNDTQQNSLAVNETYLIPACHFRGIPTSEIVAANVILQISLKDWRTLLFELHNLVSSQ